MTCADYRNRLSAYADGELSWWNRRKVHRHLRDCPDCEGFLQELVDLDSQLLRSAPPAPDYLADAVMRRLPAMPPPRRRHGGVVFWAAGVAALQAVVLFGVYRWGFADGADTGPRGRENVRVDEPAGPRSSGAPAIWSRREGSRTVNDPAPESGEPVPGGILSLTGKEEDLRAAPAQRVREMPIARPGFKLQGAH